MILKGIELIHHFIDEVALLIRPIDSLSQILFNLKKDGMEMNNLADNPESAARLNGMKKQLKSRLDEIDADGSWLE